MVRYGAFMQKIDVVAERADKGRDELGRHPVSIDHREAFLNRKRTHVLFETTAAAAIRDSRKADLRQVPSVRGQCAEGVDNLGKIAPRQNFPQLKFRVPFARQKRLQVRD